MTLWWLSFADASRPVGQQLLGISIVDAPDMATALKVAWATGCNPGGEVNGMKVDVAMLARLSFDLPIGKLIDPTAARVLADRIAQELAS